MGSGTPMPVLFENAKKHGHASTPAHATQKNAIEDWKDKMKQSTLAAAAAVVGGAFLARRITRSMGSIDFRGRNVLITGGSRGLGLVLARQFAAEGADITLLARDGEDLERAVLDIAARGADVLGIPCDASDQTQGQRAMARSIGRHGRVDGLANE